MQSSWTQEQISRLIEAGSAADLLKLALEERRKSGSKLGYAELARRAEFSSRGFCRDVILGKATLSAATAARLAKALRLPADLVELSEALAQLQRFQTDRVRSKERDKLKLKIERKKAAIRARLYPRQIDGDEVYKTENISTVFAALGSLEVGASRVDIEKRTALKPEEIQSVLRKLIAFGLCQERQGRYFAIMNMMAFEKLQGGGFQDTFLRRLRKMEITAKRQFDRSDSFFWEGTLSVRVTDLPELHSDLKRVLEGFVSRAEASEGERVVSIVSGMFIP